MKGLYATVSETGRGVDGKKRYSLVNGNDVNVSVEESITEDDTADTTCTTLDAFPRVDLASKLTETRNVRKLSQ